MTIGIQNLRELLSFIIAVICAAADAAADGKIQVSDLFKFFSALKKAPAALKGLNEMKAEIEDITPAEKEELCLQLAKELDLDNDVIEAYIEQALSLALSLIDLIPLAAQVKK
jgi:hypothetical protein